MRSSPRKAVASTSYFTIASAWQHACPAAAGHHGPNTFRDDGNVRRYFLAEPSSSSSLHSGVLQGSLARGKLNRNVSPLPLSGAYLEETES